MDIPRFKKIIIDLAWYYAICFGVFYFTNPKYDYHKVEISNYKVIKKDLGRELIGDNKSDEEWRKLIDETVGSYYNYELMYDNFTVKNLFFFSIGFIKNPNNNDAEPVSFGILGKVFVLLD